MRGYVGLDLGAVSTNLVILDEKFDIMGEWYFRTMGDPVASVREIMKAASQLLEKTEVRAAGTTGSGRHLAAALIGADIVKNEITAHARGAIHFFPDVRTVIEIGGQDSKIIILQDGQVTDFAVNTICAAGTGSFLDHQANRMGITVDELARLAATSSESVAIGGRCAVFAETDIIEKQQRGVSRGAIAKGLCEALARNYLSTVAGGKRIDPPVVFQGGVAANLAVKQALEKQLEMEILVPEHYRVMGALGAALIAAEQGDPGRPSAFRGTIIRDMEFSLRTFVCEECSSMCEIVEVSDGSRVLGRWGGRCERWVIEQ